MSEICNDNALIVYNIHYKLGQGCRFSWTRVNHAHQFLGLDDWRMNEFHINCQ